MNAFTFSKMTQRQSAIVTGIALVLLMFVAIFAFGVVYSTLVVISDPVATATKISQNYGLFVGGLIGWLAVILLDVVIAWSLYSYLRPIEKQLALSTMILRLIYVLFLIAGVYCLTLAAIEAKSLVGMTSIVNSEQIQSIYDWALKFKFFWTVGLIPFGAHLVLVGFTTIKSSKVPKILSYLLLLAGFSYVLIHGLYTFTPDMNTLTATLEKGLSLPMAIGELGFGLWLWAKGGKKDSKVNSIAA